MKPTLTLVLLAATVFTVSAAPALIPRGTDAWLSNGRPLAEQSDPLRLTGKNQLLVSRQILPVNPAQRYRLSGQFRTAPGTPLGKFYFGLMPLDASRSQIKPAQVLTVSGTETELAKPYKAGERTVWIRSNPNWKAHRFHSVAFDVDAAGQCQDLPNANTADGILKAEELDGILKLTVQTPAKNSYPAGTKVRMHTDGPNYLYTAARGVSPTTEWKEFSGIIQGQTLNTCDPQKFFPGTRYVRIILQSISSSADSALECRELKLEEMP